MPPKNINNSIAKSAVTKSVPKSEPKSVPKSVPKSTSTKSDKNTLKGAGLKGEDDADRGDEDDYESDDQTNNEEDDVEVENVKEINSDDDLENIQESEEDEETVDELEEEQAEVQGEGDEGCIYRFTGKKKTIDLLNDIEIEDQFYDDEEQTRMETTKYVDSEKRVTKNFMTVYERVRLLGERAKQISLGAKPMIKNVQHLNPKEIAKLELEHKVLPLIIIRTLPNGLKEKWKISELEINN